ncbi:MAG: hypothetical protein M1812_005453 [Candelaria pacifica]|nr:MAG: hypothetical protein M1812_005453 [Candelaria pacifica]
MNAPATTPNDHIAPHHTSHDSQGSMDTSLPLKGTRDEPSAWHNMSPRDPDNPQNWPTYRKIFASSVSFAFALVVAFGLTSYTAGITAIVKDLNVSMTAAIVPFSLYLVGIAFAPLYTPHLAELFGRSAIYLLTFPIFSLFILGSALSQNFASLVICRFLAGFFGGPSLVLIEGTFADVWSADYTVTYYSFLGLASYIGAGLGPVIGGFVFAAKGWRWTQYVTLMMALAAYLLSIGLPETYPREVMRRRARRSRVHLELPQAQSGVTLKEQATVTIFHPLRMLISEPAVIMISFYLGFNFAVIFQWFISVPVVLNLTYNYDVKQAGLAFIAAIGGALFAAASSIAIERLTVPKLTKKSTDGIIAIETRLFPAMMGSFLITASLFWIAWTASPKIASASPILGTWVYVWGNLMVLISLVSYLFDAYPPRGTLSALTAAASLRLILAGFLPLVIIQMIKGLTGAWAFSLLGFISAACIPIPFMLFKWGATLRSRSRHGQQRTMASEMNTSSDVHVMHDIAPKVEGAV